MLPWGKDFFVGVVLTHENCMDDHWAHCFLNKFIFFSRCGLDPQFLFAAHVGDSGSKAGMTIWNAFVFFLSHFTIDNPHKTTYNNHITNSPKGLMVMKLISWNVNGLRACLNKGFADIFAGFAADIVCLQETKMEQGQAVFEPEGYTQYWNSADKKGYSGTAIFTKPIPLSVAYDIGIDVHDHEGRVITLEYADFYLVNCYTPNSQRELARLGYRMKWEEAFRSYLVGLDKHKPIILCGDLNVAHEEIDIKNAKSNRKNAGFTNEERGKMTELLGVGFSDTFRSKYPDRADAYTWWSYMANARERNIGWRIDYFIVSQRLMEHVHDALIYPDVFGSDHCPVGLEMMV